MRYSKSAGTDYSPELLELELNLDPQLRRKVEGACFRALSVLAPGKVEHTFLKTVEHYEAGKLNSLDMQTVYGEFLGLLYPKVETGPMRLGGPLKDFLAQLSVDCSYHVGNDIFAQALVPSTDPSKRRLPPLAVMAGCVNQSRCTVLALMEPAVQAVLLERDLQQQSATSPPSNRSGYWQ